MGYAMQKFIAGLGFLVAALMVTRYFPGGFVWGWSFIFPAFGAMGKGVSEYWRAREEQQRIAVQPMAQFNAQPAMQPFMPQTPVPTTSELKLPAAAQDFAQPVSVIEHTTALLDPARQKSVEKS